MINFKAAMPHSHLINSYCNNVVITIQSVFRPNDFTRAHIRSVLPSVAGTRAHIGSNCLLSRLTRAYIRSVLPSVGGTRAHIGSSYLLRRLTRAYIRSVLPSVGRTRAYIG